MDEELPEEQRGIDQGIDYEHMSKGLAMLRVSHFRALVLENSMKHCSKFF